MLPWWRGFSGTIKKVGDNKYDVLGTVKKIDDTTVEITELPIHKWTQSFKAELEAMCGEKGEGPIKVSLLSLAVAKLLAEQQIHRTTKSTTTT